MLITTLVVSNVQADAPLKRVLGLDTDQAKKVQEIESKYRRPFAAKRQERNAELRKLRRANLDNDSKAIAQHEATSDKLHEELRQIFLAKNDEIRSVLNASQRAKFEAHLQQNKETIGSSRDAKDF
jgi:Spy/CpxP family protein refolding chaperone